MSSVFEFSESLSESYRDELEQLFFFNPQQQRYYDQIVQMVEAFGQPKIEMKDGDVKLVIEGHPEINNLFAVHGSTLTGVAIYAQFSSETLSILHIAIHPEYTFHGQHRNLDLMNTLLETLQKMAHELHTVSQMTLGYAKGDRRIIALPLV